MNNSEEDDLPQDEELKDWETLDDVPIPQGLDDRWKRQEREGLRAGVCPKCGFPFSQEELRCIHCDTPTEISKAFLPVLKHWFLGTPLGIMIFIVIIAAVVMLIVRF